MTAVGVPCYKLDKYLNCVLENFNYPSHVIREDYKVVKEEVVRNRILDDLAHYLHVFTVDSDEFILKEDQEKILDLVGKHDAVFIPVINYTRDLKHRYKMTDHKPVVLVKPKEVRFYDGRCLRFHKPLHIDDVYLHHFGFTWSDEERDWKKQNYWNNGNPREYEQILKREIEECEVPNEIMDLIRRHNVNIK